MSKATERLYKVRNGKLLLELAGKGSLVTLEGRLGVPAVSGPRQSGGGKWGQQRPLCLGD